MALQTLVELAHRGLAIGEDDRRFDLVVAEQPAQGLALLALLHGDLESGDILVRRRRTADFDTLGILEEFLRKLFDRRRHRRREQHRLAAFGQLVADEFDVGDEPHVEHPVRFVDDQKFAAVEQDLPTLEQVHEAARRGNQHVDALVQGLDLVAHLHAADKQRELEVMVLAVFLEILGHLRSQFACRREDQRARHQGAAATAGHDIDHGQDEARRLAGSGLRDTDDVLHHQDGRDGLGLDRRRLGIAGVGDGFEQVR